MASLAAVTWPKPVCIVPCLSWSTASGVFTQGVLSNAIDWKSLEKQFFSNNFFKEELYKMVWSNNDDAYLAGKEFVSQFKEDLNRPLGAERKGATFDSEQERNVFQALTNFLRERGLLKILPNLGVTTTRQSSDDDIINGT